MSIWNSFQMGHLFFQKIMTFHLIMENWKLFISEVLFRVLLLVKDNQFKKKIFDCLVFIIIILISSANNSCKMG